MQDINIKEKLEGSQRRDLKAFSLSIAILVGLLTSTLAVFAWVEPTATPPASNAPAPIHSGGGTQNKTGALGLVSTDVTTPALAVNNNALIQATGYVNWGATSGSTGYGFRSNGGVMQFKNSTGNWTDIGKGSASAQYGYSQQDALSPCEFPSVSNMVCEILGNGAFPPSGWTQVVSSTGTAYAHKVIPDQATTPWTFCSMNAYATPWDHSTNTLVAKKPDGKWYVYFGLTNNWAHNRQAVIANCWR